MIVRPMSVKTGVPFDFMPLKFTCRLHFLRLQVHPLSMEQMSSTHGVPQKAKESCYILLLRSAKTLSMLNPTCQMLRRQSYQVAPTIGVRHWGQHEYVVIFVAGSGERVERESKLLDSHHSRWRLVMPCLYCARA